MDTFSGTTKITVTGTISPVRYQRAVMTGTQESFSAVVMTDTLLTPLIFPLTSPSFCSSIHINVRMSLMLKYRKDSSTGTMKITYPMLVSLKANTPFWKRTIIILKSTTVIITNNHKNTKFSHMHYLVKCILLRN